MRLDQVRRFEAKIWKTRNGKAIPWRSMSDQHLENTAQMLLRLAKEEESAYWSYGCTLRGEAALDSWAAAETDVLRRCNARRTLAKAMSFYRRARRAKHATHAT